jgi:hypothetical protein
MCFPKRNSSICCDVLQYLMKYATLKEKVNSKTCSDINLLALCLYSAWYGYERQCVRNYVCLAYNIVTKTPTLTVTISGEFTACYLQCWNKILMDSGLNIVAIRGNRCHTIADSKGHGRMSTGHRTARLAIWRPSLGDDCVGKQYDSSKITVLYYSLKWITRNICTQIYFLTDRLDVLAYVSGYENMTKAQMSAYSVCYCSNKQDICMNNKEGSR